jgi:hypothetical protein
MICSFQTACQAQHFDWYYGIAFEGMIPNENSRIILSNPTSCVILPVLPLAKI